MKKKKHIQTDFIRFMLEKYIDQDDSSIDQDPDEPQNSKKLKKLVELDDEVNDDEDDEVPTDDLIDELVNEYKRLKKANESYRIHYRRKR
jgi:hypothetical protein